MEFEGLVCPKCSNSLNEKELAEKLSCPHCNTKFHDKKYIAFIEYLMMNGIVTDIDFFDKKLYGDEIKYKSETEQELVDETNPDGIKNSYKISTSQEGVEEEEEDWQEFNKRNQKDQKHGSRKKKK